MTLHHDPLHSKVPDFNFLDFLVNCLLETSHSESKNHTCKAIPHLHKIPSVSCIPSKFFLFFAKAVEEILL